MITVIRTGFSLVALESALENISATFMKFIFFLILCCGLCKCRDFRRVFAFMIPQDKSYKQDFVVHFHAGRMPYLSAPRPRRNQKMMNYEKCKNCDCYNPDYEDGERSGQIMNACDLCEMSEEDWRKFMETAE